MTRTTLSTGFLALLLATAAGPLAAQQPDTTAPDRWKTVVDLAFSTVSGNQSLTVLSSQVKVTHLIEADYELELILRARYGRSDGEDVAKNYRGQLRFELRPQAAWSPFLSTTAEHDAVRHLRIRVNGGAGARYRFWNVDDGSASISGAVLYSYEDYGGASLDAAVGQLERDARWSWRFKAEKQIGKGVHLEHTTYYQPIWNRSGDYLLNVETTARVLLNEQVALSLSQSFERDSTPLPDVKPNDQLVKVGLTLQL